MSTSPPSSPPPHSPRVGSSQGERLQDAAPDLESPLPGVLTGSTGPARPTPPRVDLICLWDNSPREQAGRNSSRPVCSRLVSPMLTCLGAGIHFDKVDMQQVCLGTKTAPQLLELSHMGFCSGFRETARKEAPNTGKGQSYHTLWYFPTDFLTSYLRQV